MKEIEINGAYRTMLKPVIRLKEKHKCNSSKCVNDAVLGLKSKKDPKHLTSYRCLQCAINLKWVSEYGSVYNK